jgi:hypothetical protein
VTHLIALTPTGEKYNFARTNNIQVITPQWHTDCVAANGQVGVNKSEYQLLEPAPAPAQRESRSKMAAARKTDRSHEHRSSSAVSEAEAKLDVEHDPENQYLDGCRVYLHGVTASRLQLMTKIIRAAGGTKYSSLDNMVTHVVFAGAELPAAQQELCNRLQNAPPIVKESWLIACLKGSALVPVKEHTTSGFDPLLNAVKEKVSRSTARTHQQQQHPPSPQQQQQQQPTSPALTDADLDFTNMFGGAWGENGRPSAGAVMSPSPAVRAALPTNDSMHAGFVEEDEDEDIEPEERLRRQTTRSVLLSGFKIAVAAPSANLSIEELQSQIQKHGGTYEENVDAANCVLVPLIGGYTQQSSKQVVATTYWFEWCTTDVRLYDPSTSFLFQPCDVTLNMRIFRRACICTSGFEELAKTHLEQLCIAVGATVTQKFKRKETTFLICDEPSGQKYTKALSWNVPAVRHDWLFDSVKQGRLVNASDYVVTDPLPSTYRHRETTLVRLMEDLDSKNASKPATAASKDALDSAVVAASVTTSNMATDTSTAIDSPCRPVFDTNGILGALQTPQTLSKSLLTHSLRGRNGEETEPEQSEDSVALSDMFTSGLAQANQQIRRDASSVLEGVVIFIAKKLLKRPLDLVAAATQLGATVLGKLDESCTHFVFKGRSHDPSKEYKQAKGKCHVVAPEWLTETLHSSTRQVEANYPHTFNPKLSLGGVSSLTKSPATRSAPATPFASDGNSAKRARSLSTPGSAGQPSNLVAGSAASSGMATTSASAKPEDKKVKVLPAAVSAGGSMLKSAVEDFINSHRRVTTKAPKRSRLGPVSASSPGPSNEPSSNVCSISAMERTGSTSSSFPRIAPEQESLNASAEDDVTLLFQSGASREQYDSQSPDREPDEAYSQAAVVYDDPDRVERQRMIAQLQLDTRGGASAKPPASYKVLLSNFDATQKAELSILVRDLGGEVLEARNWDPLCTHLIVGTPTRSEKFLAACAAGKWVLRSSFLHISAENGTFVPEAEHEFTIATMENNKSASMKRLAAAPRRWRTQLENEPANAGAFSGWDVLLCVSESKREGFRRLLIAGGAHVVSLNLPYPTDVSATHMFVEADKQGGESAKAVAAAPDGVKILKADYIAEYLASSCPPPPPHTHSLCVCLPRYVLLRTFVRTLTLHLSDMP